MNISPARKYPEMQLKCEVLAPRSVDDARGRGYEAPAPRARVYEATPPHIAIACHVSVQLLDLS